MKGRKRWGRGRWASFGGTVLALAALVAVVGSSAFGSSVSSASFTAGGVVVSGTRYAKQGQLLTLTVTTSSDTKCVEITGAHTDRQTSSTAKSNWTFDFTAGAGDGLKVVTAAASPNFNANNCTGQSQNPQSASYVLDNTGPTLLPSNTDKTGVSPAPNAAGWNNTNVNINWSAVDSGSGVGSGPSPATDSQNSNTSGATKTATASDRLGNAGAGSVTIKLDKMNPTVSATPTPAPNGNGWNNTNVSLLVSCSDALSGIKACTGGGTFTFSSEGAHQSTPVTATDNADNSVSQNAGDVSIDKTAPSLAGTPTTSVNGNGWYKNDVTIHWTCSDALSGLAGSCPADSTIAGEGDDLFDTKSVSDRAGNGTTSNSTHVKIDRHAPVTNATAPPAWNNVDVSVTLDPSDALSGLDGTFYKIDGGSQQSYSPIAKPSFATQGDHTLEYWSIDKAGNEETHHTIHVGIDKSPPTITHTLSPVPNANGWNNSDVTVHFICDDQATLSGIASCTSDQVLASEGAGQTVNGTAVDNAGNDAHDPAGVSLDKTPPTISAAVDRSPNANNWYDADVIVSFTCGDLLSGVDTCPAPQTVGEGAGQSASGTVHDIAGNSASAGVSGLNVDKTRPSLTGAPTTSPNGNGWFKDDVTIHWTCSDALSGIDGSCPADETLTGEGDNLSTGALVSDLAGNTKDALAGPVKIDRHAPDTTPSVPSPATPDGWYADSVQVALNALDPLSGVAATYYRVDGGSQQTYGGPFAFDLNGEHTITFWSVDRADNTEDNSDAGHSITVKVDKSNPTIAAVVPPANGYGWYMSPVVVSFNCDDDESGIDECTAPVTLNEGANQSAHGQAKDRVGHTAQTDATGINVDLTAPSVAGNATMAPSVHGWYKDDVTIHWTATDGLSGIDDTLTHLTDSVIGGEGSNLGATSDAAYDRAGNSSTGSVSGIKIDRTDPTIHATPDRAPNLNGWYKDDVVVSFGCADALSGVDDCPTAQTFHEGAGQSASGIVHDKAGNAASATLSAVNVDKTAPTITASAKTADGNAYAAGTWTKQTVTVHYECSDALSGLVASACPADRVISSSTAVTGESVSGTVNDRANNSTTSAAILVKVDKTLPSLSITSPTSGSVVSTDTVIVTGNVSDTPSGVAGVTLNGTPATVTGNTYSGSAALSCGNNTIAAVASDNAANTAQTQVSVTRSCLWVSDVLQPVATATNSQGDPLAANLGAFKIKSTIPVKFRVYLDQARTQLMTSPPAGSHAGITFGRQDSSTDTTDLTDTLTGTANTDGMFRWTGSPDYQYIYNLGTTGKTAGTYYVQLTLFASDGTQLGQSAKQYFVLRS
jgi:hypothetical protein